MNGHSPRWSPAGDRLLFLACGTPGGDPGARDDCPEGAHQQVWVRIMEGEGRGAVTQVTRLTEDAKAPGWSPDGERIAFTAFAPGDEEPFTVEMPERPEGAEWTEAPRVVDDVW
jgi:Tol biopolymer transport system component